MDRHQDVHISVTFNHCIIAACARLEPAVFFTDLFDHPEPAHLGPSALVRLGIGVFIQVAEQNIDASQMQQYACLVDDNLLDPVYRF